MFLSGSCSKSLIPYQIKEMEDKLNKLRGGVELVKPEERKAIEQIYLESTSQWRRRRRMFKDLWDAITENSPKDLKEFKVSYIFLRSCRLVIALAEIIVNCCKLF